jgi:recombination protein RecT
MQSNSAQKDFAEDMARRTVINRACKYFVNTSDDSDLLIDSFDRTEEKNVDDAVGQEILDNANTEMIDVSYTIDSDGVIEEPAAEIEQPVGEKKLPF